MWEELFCHLNFDQFYGLTIERSTRGGHAFLSSIPQETTKVGKAGKQFPKLKHEV